MGAPRYGRFCVVDRRTPGETAPDPVWVAEDTLCGHRTRDASGRLLWRWLARWVAPSCMAAELAAVKLASMPAAAPLAHRVCNDHDYIEALSLEPLRLDCVQEIRDRIRSLAQARGIPWVEVTS